MQEAIHHLRANDPMLSAIIDRVGDYGIQFRDPDFETLVRSIVYQQLSGRVASVIFDRLSAAVKGDMTPETILRLRPSRMRTLGLSTQKTAYIRDLARHTRDGKVVFEELAALPDNGGHRAADPGERHRRLDRPHVPDVRPAPHTTSCPRAIWGSATRFARPTTWRSCPPRPRWSRSPQPGAPTARWQAGTSGAAWKATQTSKFMKED